MDAASGARVTWATQVWDPPSVQTGRSGHGAREVAEQVGRVDALLDDRGSVLDVLDRVTALRGAAQAVRDVTGADLGFLAELSGPGDPAVIRWLAGNRTEALAEISVPTGRGIGGRVLATGDAARVNDYLTSAVITHDYDGPVSVEGLGAMLAVPVTSSDGDIVAIAYAGLREGAGFGDDAVDRLRRLADRTGSALDVAGAVERHLRTALVEDRRRLQLSMHDSVGAMLFSIGAQVHDLHECTRRNPQLGARLRKLEVDVSAASAALRDSLLALGDNGDEAETAAALATVQHCRSFEARTGVVARMVQLSALPALDIERTGTLVAGVREGLLNAEKHARAGSVVVSIGLCAGGVQVAVADDGAGAPEDGAVAPSTGLGLRALAERAERLGGRVSLVRDPDGATLRTWIPVVDEPGPEHR